MDILSLFDRNCYAKCITCGCLIRKEKFAVLSGTIGICAKCHDHLPIVPTGSTFQEKNGYVRYSISTFFYKSPIRELIIDYKFNDCSLYAKVFAQYMKIYITSTFQSDLQADLVIPVPLSEDRMKERGYNQSLLLSKPIAEELGIAHSADALIRILPTRHQSKLPAWKRGENLKAAFEADSDIVKNKSILLIDDVYTTGNTVKSCAEALHKAGAASIAVFTLARKFKIDKSKEYRSLFQN